MRISISQVKLFKACRRAYELRYIERMFPVEEAEPLTVGKSFHSKIEDLYNTGSYEKEPDKQTAMVMAFEKYIYPKIKLVDAEKWFESDLDENNSLLGRVDGISEDGRIVEYKTTSATSIDEYEYDLQWDEQLLAYMYLTGVNKAHYAVIRKPTIRQKKSETEEEFFERMVDWYDEDTYEKIRLLDVRRSAEEVQEFINGLKRLINEMQTNDNFYKNTSYCWKWGRRCEYESICRHFDPNETYIGFERREKSTWRSTELTNK